MKCETYAKKEWQAKLLRRSKWKTRQTREEGIQDILTVKQIWWNVAKDHKKWNILCNTS